MPAVETTTGMPALPAIIAKVMVLVEYVLDCFVTVGYNAPAGADVCCDWGLYQGNVSSCGLALSTDLSALIAQIMDMAGQVVASLMVKIW